MWQGLGGGTTLCEKTQEAAPILDRAGGEGRGEDGFSSASVSHYATLFLSGSKVPSVFPVFSSQQDVSLDCHFRNSSHTVNRPTEPPQRLLLSYNHDTLMTQLLASLLVKIPSLDMQLPPE